jgi:nicotinamidase-related amidase
LTRESRTLISREDSLLVVIDVQERLLPVVTGRTRVLDNALRLVRFAGIIGLPVVVTEQDKLGQTVPELRDALQEYRPIPKLTFDCFGTELFRNSLESLKRPILIFAGIEAHICVLQTVLTALERFTVHVVSDAVSSRTSHNWGIALDRMRQHGAVITSTETVIYELLKKAGTEEFKAALKLVK